MFGVGDFLDFLEKECGCFRVMFRKQWATRAEEPGFFERESLENYQCRGNDFVIFIFYNYDPEFSATWNLRLKFAPLPGLVKVGLWMILEKTVVGSLIQVGENACLHEFVVKYWLSLALIVEER